MAKTRALLRLMNRCGLSSIELKEAGFSLTLRRGPTRAPHEAATLVAADPSPATVIASPEVGRVRLAHPLRSRKPAAGQLVATGEPILFIASGGRLFAVESPTAGRIAKILVRDGQRVDYGAALALLVTCNK